MGVNAQSRVFFRCPYSNPKRLENAKSGTVLFESAGVVELAYMRDLKSRALTD